MELRDYQKTQVDYLKSHISNDRKVFDKTISLQSPTGSGKSFVMLSFIKDYFDKFPGSKIFISTGFNELVYQFYNEALKLGINTDILIGKLNATCLLKTKSDSYYAFEKDLDKKYRCNPFECYGCVHRKCDCLYDRVMDRINSPGSKLVITNHSTLIKNSGKFSHFNGGFIDECQSFGDFYELAKSISITSQEIKAVLHHAKKYGIENNSIKLAVLENQINTGTVTAKALNNVLEMVCFGGKEYKLKKKFYRISEEVEKLLYVDKDAIDTFVHPQIEDGVFQGIKVDKFFDKVGISHNVCLVSATVDQYTKNVFDCKDSYVEKNCNIIDYSKSNIEYSPYINEWNLSSFISKQTSEHGLFLSTRLDIVENYLGKTVCGYKFVKNINDLVPGEKQILIGSKRLFQGIDVGSVGFVILNKIPFPRYDASYRKKMRYFETLGHSSYTYYTIPYTTNQLTQTMGRLWRNKGDFGNIIIFDSESVKKHKNIVNLSLEMRKGITTKE